MSKPILSCIVCSETLMPAIQSKEDDFNELLENALLFRGRGNYGSQYDDLPEGRNAVFKIAVCDECFEKAVVKSQVLVQETITTSTTVSKIATF